MTALAPPAAPLPPTVLPAALPPYAHREAFEPYFDRLARWPVAADGMRRLLGLVDADLLPTEELAFWRAFWACGQRLAASEREPLSACLDGRHAALLQAVRWSWSDPRTLEGLAARRGTVHDAAHGHFVTALLREHGLDPVAEPAAVPSSLVILAVRAELATARERLDAPAIARLQAAVEEAAARDGQCTGDAVALLFDLALHAAEAATADATLALLLGNGLANRVAPERVLAWLDGSAWLDDLSHHLPLQLSKTLQPAWLDPARWAEPAVLARLAACLHREGPRTRVAALASHLGVDLAGTRAAADGEAWQALRRLDACHARLEAHADPVATTDALLAGKAIGPRVRLAWRRLRAGLRVAQGDAEAAAVELAAARKAASCPRSRADLLDLLRRLAPQAVPADFAFQTDWRDEEPVWASLSRHPQPAVQRIATFHLARLWTDGSLEPKAPCKLRRLDDAAPLWQQIAGHPAYAAAARQALGSLPFTFTRRVARREGGREHLWIEAPERDCERLTIVFSCLLSHHTYPDVQEFVEGLRGRHLLFINNPELNWYSDAAFDAICEVMRARVLPRFRPGHVTCHYGSMGGHAALKIALQFGFRAAVFNPQTDLDLWAAFRRRERPHLWAAERHASLQAWPDGALARAPLYYACGSYAADREALSVLIGRLRACRDATAIIEKFDDPHHPGLMGRISPDGVPRTLLRIDRRLDELSAPAATPGAAEVPAWQVASFWNDLDVARARKIELQVRDGRLWWQPSTRTGTRAG